MSVPPLYMTESSFQIRFVMVLAIRSLLKQCGPILFRLPSKTQAPNSLRMPLVHVAVGHGVAPWWFQVECDGRMCTTPIAVRGYFGGSYSIWGPCWKGSVVACHCNYTVLVSAVQFRSCRPCNMSCICCTVCLLFYILWRPVLISSWVCAYCGHQNDCADHLLLNCLPSFLAKMTEAHPLPCPIPSGVRRTWISSCQGEQSIQRAAYWPHSPHISELTLLVSPVKWCDRRGMGRDHLHTLRPYTGGGGNQTLPKPISYLLCSYQLECLSIQYLYPWVSY